MQHGLEVRFELRFDKLKDGQALLQQGGHIRDGMRRLTSSRVDRDIPGAQALHSEHLTMSLKYFASGGYNYLLNRRVKAFAVVGSVIEAKHLLPAIVAEAIQVSIVRNLLPKLHHFDPDIVDSLPILQLTPHYSTPRLFTSLAVRIIHYGIESTDRLLLALP